LRRGWNLSAAAGGDLYTKTTDVGVFLIAVDDRTTSARVDLGGPFGGWNVRVGADTGEQRDVETGTVPNRGGDFGGVSGESGFQLSRHDWHAGAYGEVSRTMGRLTPTIGIRTDHFGDSDATRADPRVNLTYDLGRPGRLRFAWGFYHQAPSAEYFDEVRGADTQLSPMAATHYIAGYEIGSITGALFFRAEAYVKTYRQLPV